MYRAFCTGISTCPALPCASFQHSNLQHEPQKNPKRTKNKKKKKTANHTEDTRLHCCARRRHDRSAAGAAGRLRHSRHRQHRVVTEAAGRMKCCSFLLGSAPCLPSRPPFIPATARLCLPQHSIAEAWCAFANDIVQFSTSRLDTTVKAILGAALRHQLVAPEPCQDHLSFQLHLSARPCIKHQNNDIYKTISLHHSHICNLPSSAFLGTQRGRLHPFPTIGYSL